nr:hypothetical protein [Tanacetum cinerariifolium]
MDSQVNASKREGTAERVNHDNLRSHLQQSHEDAANVGKNNFDSSGLLGGSVTFDGEELLRSVNASKREGTAERVNHDNLRSPLQQSHEDAANVGKNNFDSSGLLGGSVTFDGEELLRDVNANASQSTPSIQHDIISELFGVSLKTYKDFEDFINNIELGKCEVWLELSEEKRQDVFYTSCAMFKAFKVENPDDSIPSKASPSDLIVQHVDINKEDVKNVYDETTNLFPNTKIDGSSSFTAAAAAPLKKRAEIQDFESRWIEGKISSSWTEEVSSGFAQEQPRLQTLPKAMSEMDNEGKTIDESRNKLANAKPDETSSVHDEDIFPSIQRLSKSWISARFFKGAAAWDKWISKPFDVLNLI